MSEEEKPVYCPFCNEEDDVDVIGQTDDGSYVIHCEGCEKDVLVKDVTGKVTIAIKVG